jgi:hypothetical protein
MILTGGCGGLTGLRLAILPLFREKFGKRNLSNEELRVLANYRRVACELPPLLDQRTYTAVSECLRGDDRGIPQEVDASRFGLMLQPNTPNHHSIRARSTTGREG